MSTALQILSFQQKFPTYFRLPFFCLLRYDVTHEYHFENSYYNIYAKYIERKSLSYKILRVIIHAKRQVVTLIKRPGYYILFTIYLNIFIINVICFAF